MLSWRWLCELQACSRNKLDNITGLFILWVCLHFEFVYISNLFTFWVCLHFEFVYIANLFTFRICLHFESDNIVSLFNTSLFAFSLFVSCLYMFGFCINYDCPLDDLPSVLLLPAWEWLEYQNRVTRGTYLWVRPDCRLKSSGKKSPYQLFGH